MFVSVSPYTMCCIMLTILDLMQSAKHVEILKLKSVSMHKSLMHAHMLIGFAFMLVRTRNDNHFLCFSWTKKELGMRAQRRKLSDHRLFVGAGHCVMSCLSV